MTDTIISPHDHALPDRVYNYSDTEDLDESEKKIYINILSRVKEAIERGERKLLLDKPIDINVNLNITRSLKFEQASAPGFPIQLSWFNGYDTNKMLDGINKVL